MATSSWVPLTIVMFLQKLNHYKTQVYYFIILGFSYCFEHSRLAQRTRTKQLSRRKPPQCLESTLYGLSHYLVNSLKEKSIKIREGFSYYWSQESQDRDEDTEEEEEPIEVTHDENGKILPLDPMSKIIRSTR